MAGLKQKKLKWSRKATIMYIEDKYAGIEVNARHALNKSFGSGIGHRGRKQV